MSLGKFTIAAVLSVFVVSCTNLSTEEDSPVVSTTYPKVSAQKPSNYTIQIALGADATQLENSLNNVPINCELFKFKIKQGKKESDSVITCGSFSSLEEANTVLLTLPLEMNTSTAGIYQWKVLQRRIANDESAS